MKTVFFSGVVCASLTFFWLYTNVSIIHLVPFKTIQQSSLPADRPTHQLTVLLDHHHHLRPPCSSYTLASHRNVFIIHESLTLQVHGAYTVLQVVIIVIVLHVTNVLQQDLSHRRVIRKGNTIVMVDRRS